MNRGSRGRQWLAMSGGEYTFKITIEDGLNISIDTVLDGLRNLPAPYLRAAQEVSEASEDGIALYADLGGAAGHGGKNYINVVSADSYLLAHEMGHTLEQVAAEIEPAIQDLWRDAIAADNVSVSNYGNVASWEDLAEFSALYAASLNSAAVGSRVLLRLKRASPARFNLWEEILYETVGIEPNADYNNDGVIDAADYTVWRDGNSPDNSPAGYDLWANSYGATVPSSSEAISVPEPMTPCLALASVAMAAAFRRRSVR